MMNTSKKIGKIISIGILSVAGACGPVQVNPTLPTYTAAQPGTAFQPVPGLSFLAGTWKLSGTCGAQVLPIFNSSSASPSTLTFNASTATLTLNDQYRRETYTFSVVSQPITTPVTPLTPNPSPSSTPTAATAATMTLRMSVNPTCTSPTTGTVQTCTLLTAYSFDWIFTLTSATPTSSAGSVIYANSLNDSLCAGFRYPGASNFSLQRLN